MNNTIYLVIENRLDYDDYAIGQGIIMRAYTSHRKATEFADKLSLERGAAEGGRKYGHRVERVMLDD
jgi:hypothetical protein